MLPPPPTQGFSQDRAVGGYLEDSQKKKNLHKKKRNKKKATDAPVETRAPNFSGKDPKSMEQKQKLIHSITNSLEK